LLGPVLLCLSSAIPQGSVVRRTCAGEADLHSLFLSTTQVVVFQILHARPFPFTWKVPLRMAAAQQLNRACVPPLCQNIHSVSGFPLVVNTMASCRRGNRLCELSTSPRSISKSWSWLYVHFCAQPMPPFYVCGSVLPCLVTSSASSRLSCLPNFSFRCTLLGPQFLLRREGSFFSNVTAVSGAPPFPTLPRSCYRGPLPPLPISTLFQPLTVFFCY